MVQSCAYFESNALFPIRLRSCSDNGRNDRSVVGGRYSTFNPMHYVTNLAVRQEHSKFVADIFDRKWHQHEKLDEKLPDIPFTELFGGKRRAMSFLNSNEKLFKHYFTMSKIKEPACVNSMLRSSARKVIPFLKSFTDYVKRNSSNLPPIAFLYCELGTLVGYPATKNRTLDDDPVAWLSVDVNDQHPKEWYTRRMLGILISTNPRPSLSYREFVLSRWLWVSDGSTSRSHLKLDGETIKTKFAAAVSLPDDELLKIAYAKAGVDMPVFIKPDEKGVKKRLITSVNLSGYLKAAYVRYLITNLGNVSNFMKDTLNLDDDLTVMQLLRQGRTSIPIDESKFDYHVSRAAYQGFFDAIKLLFPENEGVDVFLEWARSPPRWKYENQIGYWMKGQPSGLALTSLVNSLINYCKQIDIASPIHYALGDDVLVFNDQMSLEEVSDYYQTFGSEVNPSKNFRSSDYAEYLHFIFSKYGKTGYGARIYSSLVWGQSLPKIDVKSKLFETANLFREFYDRNFLKMDEDKVAADLSRAVGNTFKGFRISHGKIWLHTPRAVGGLGLMPSSGFQFDVKSKVTGKKYYIGSLIDLPPIIQKQELDFHFTKFKLKRGVQAQFGGLVSLPEITSMKQWEDRLNMREELVTPLQYEFGACTIPLPTLPFVSESRMAMLCNYYGYFAWPNASGNAYSRVSRFIIGAELLARQVQFMMEQNRIDFYL